MRTAVIILGHGSRSGGADMILHNLAETLRKNGDYTAVEHAFLQYQNPNPHDAMAACLSRKAEKILFVPFFLQPGRHVRDDIPVLLEQAKKMYPAVTFAVSDFVGAHTLMIEIVRDLIRKN